METTFKLLIDHQTSVSGICLQLSEEDMMYIYKIEMSFENSNNSIPVMSDETSEIWEFISKSCNLMSISQSFTGSLLTEVDTYTVIRGVLLTIFWCGFCFLGERSAF